MKKVIISLTALFYVFTAQANTISVATYGAIPNDGLNDKTAITNAINAAGSGDTIIFPTGTYNLDGAGTKLMLFSKNNLVIDGQGSILTCTTWSIVFGCYSSNNITVKNFTVNWDNDLPFSGGTVIAKGASYVDVRVKGNHTVRTGLTVGAIFKYDSINMRPFTNGYDIYQSNATTTTSPLAGVLRVPVVAASLPSINVNDNIVIRFQVYSGDFFNTIGPNVSNITLDNITVNSEPGMFLYSRSVTNLTINNINILRKPGFWMTTTADGLHFNNDRGVINVTNSTLESMGDDGVNFHSNYTRITAKAANSITLVDASSGNITYADQDPKVGDSLEVTDPTTLAVVAKLFVQSVTRNASNITVTTTTAVPAAVAVNQFAANASSVPVGTISNSTIRNNRARGILIQNRNVTINNCTLQNCSWPGVLVETTASWFYESITPKNVTIQNCTFNNCNYWSGYQGQLAIRAYNSSQVIAPVGVVKNINILDNSFMGSYNSTDNRSAIFISAADSIYIRGNTFDPNYLNQSIYWVNTGYNLFINTANPCTASTPNGSAVTLPATILAENVDIGGQTIAYFERTIPSPNPTPANTLLQKGTCGAGCSGFYVNTMEKNEWTQYSVTLTQPSIYNAIFNVGSTSVGGAVFHLERNHVNLTGTLSVAQTGSSFTNVVASNIVLPQGTYPVRVVVESGTLTFDNIQFIFVTASLPVQFISMNVNWINDNGNITWKVNEESSCTDYEILRSFNGTDFIKIATIPCNRSNGIADYNFIDRHVLNVAGNNSIIYYRLVSIEQSGVRKILGNSILRQKKLSGFSVYPNPANGKSTIYINANTGYAGMAYIIIADVTGQNIIRQPFQSTSTNNTIAVNIASLGAGTYFISLLNVTGEKTGPVQKLIK
jgi:hypothetical protein